MLEYIFGSINKERVLLFLYARQEGYAREISKYYLSDVSPIQNQLQNLENGGILISKSVGKTRVYSYNRRYPFYSELQNLLKKALEFLPEDEMKKLVVIRKRPRRQDKPL